MEINIIIIETRVSLDRLSLLPVSCVILALKESGSSGCRVARVASLRTLVAQVPASLVSIILLYCLASWLFPTTYLSTLGA